MKKIVVAAVLSTSILSSVAFAENIVAKYSGGNVTDEQVMKQFKPMLDVQEDAKGKSFKDLDPKLKEALVRSYINAKLLDEEAKKQKVKDSKEFKEKLAAVEQQMMQQVLIEQFLEKNVTKAKIDKEYATLVSQVKGQQEVRTSHILLDSEEKAKEVKGKLDKSGNFEELAKSFSKDQGSKVKGGDIGYTLRGQLVPEYETKAFAMSKGQISDPVKSQFGWHIIKLIDKRDAKAPSKEQAEMGIRQKLSKEAMDKYFEDLSKNAKVELKF